jgi:hypothetical protein
MEFLTLFSIAMDYLPI